MLVTIINVADERIRATAIESGSLTHLLRNLGLPESKSNKRKLAARLTSIGVELNKTQSPVWLDRLKALPALVSESKSYSEVLRKFGLTSYGGSHETLKKYVSQLALDTTHFLNGGATTRVDLASLLVNGSVVSTARLKRKLLAAGLLENKCAACGQLPEWQGQPLVLQLEHKNGCSTDNRLENLELLCPNCHSQTATYAGRNATRKQLKTATAVAVPEKQPKTKRAERPAKARPTKIDWPSDAELAARLTSAPAVRVAKTLGVSDRAITKRCTKRGIPKPSVGHWARQVPSAASSSILESMV